MERTVFLNTFQSLLLDFKTEKLTGKDSPKQLSRQNYVFENNLNYYQSINAKKKIGQFRAVLMRCFHINCL